MQRGVSHTQSEETDAKSGQAVYFVPAVRNILLDGPGSLLEVQNPNERNDRQEGWSKSRTTV
jgi:hypothetical protein